MRFHTQRADGNRAEGSLPGRAVLSVAGLVNNPWLLQLSALGLIYFLSLCVHALQAPGAGS